MKPSNATQLAWPPAWHTLGPDEACSLLAVQPEAGLPEAEARSRLGQHGPNRWRQRKREPLWEKVLEEVREPMILLLLAIGVLYGIWGELGETITIFFVIFTVMAVEIVNEHRAGNAIAALERLAEPTALVRRDGRVVEIPAQDVVPGDVILLEPGRFVPADARLVDAFGLAADESSLTGESVPAEKEAASIVAGAVPLAERRNLVFAGTTITRGKGVAVATATGMATEMGKVARLAQETRPPRTPLQLAMRDLTRWLVGLAIGFSIGVPVLGAFLAGLPLDQMVLTGLSLAFATIPEEGPIIITMVLALGGYRLSQQNAIVKRLRAVETLGAVTVIATDKTGTLTENRMEVKLLYPEGCRERILEIGVLCNDAPDESKGDPIDTALLRAARAEGMEVDALRRMRRALDEFTFDSARRRMSVVWNAGSASWVGVKGAPEAVLEVCRARRTGDGEKSLEAQDRDAILQTAAGFAREGLRVIALAEKKLAQTPQSRISQEAAESDLTFVGLAVFEDPPRPEAKAAVGACKAAGIRTIMITGDHPLTAQAIAREVGLDERGRVLTGSDLDRLSAEALTQAVAETSVYARVAPEHKLRIVKALQEKGERVAVTGDGTNDAPALVAADIGVAMGRSGTDVARAAGDIVLADDNFSTIVRAIEEGRHLFINLQKALRYYLACKVALVSSTLLPVLLGVPVPLSPIQIILTELFMDLAASSTFVLERAESGLMRRPPRDSRARFMDRAMVASIFVAAAGLFAAVSVAYLTTWYQTADLQRAQTVAFVTWLLGHVFLAFNLRSEHDPLARMGFFSNRFMVLWGAATLVFVLLITLVPPVGALLKSSSMTGAEWLLAIGAALIGSFWLEVRKLVRARSRREA